MRISPIRLSVPGVTLINQRSLPAAPRQQALQDVFRELTMSANENHIPNALPAGYRFNEFEIRDVVGGGGFGIVYRAWDHQLERFIAIKEYMPQSLAVRAADMSLELRGERFQKLFKPFFNYLDGQRYQFNRLKLSGQRKHCRQFGYRSLVLCKLKELH